ncbi:MAG TPA: RNA polymerase sigma factor [Woeseiaceae bacterium]|nr:RNA polymerase sigma factor [Woeseiaceae bacterium]
MKSDNAKVALAYTRYANQVRSFILSKTGCFQTAEDLTHEAYIRFHKKAGSCSGINDIRAYLFRIAQNLVIDHYRAANARISPGYQIDTVEDCDLASDLPSAEEILHRRERIADVVRTVGELSPLCQRIFWLSRGAGYRNHEIAAMQRVCLSTVEKNLSRASRRCLRMQQAA